MIRATIFSCFLNKFFLTEGLIVQEQFYTSGIWEGPNWNLTIDQHITFLERFFSPIPVRHDTNSWFFFGTIPFTTVEIEIILRQACRINDTKVRAFHWCIILVMPWCRFTDIVKTSPDELTCIASTITVKGPRFSSCSTPGYTVITIVRLFIMTIWTIVVPE